MPAQPSAICATNENATAGNGGAPNSLSHDQPSTDIRHALVVSTFTNEKDNAPRAVTLTWDALADHLSKVRAMPCTTATCARSECPHKKGPAWSPVRYVEGTTRGAKNVAEVTALVLDVDGISTDRLREIASMLEKRGLRFIVHSSHSDTPSDRRVRFVLDIEKPVPGNEWPSYWKAAIAELGIEVDPTTKDASRIFFTPSRPSDAPYAFASHAGRSLSISYEPIASIAESPIVGVANIPPSHELARAASSIADAWPKTGRHMASLALCGALAKEGWPEDQITNFVTMVAKLVTGEDGEPEKRQAQARDSIAKVENGEAVKGWSGLEGILPEDVIAKTKERLGITIADFDSFTVHEIESTQGIELPDSRIEMPLSLDEIAALDVPPVRNYPSGFPSVDQRIGGGLSSRALHVVVSRTGAGKTGWGLEVLLHNARMGIPGLYIGTELDGNEVFCRLAALILKVAHKDILYGTIPRVEARRAIAGLPIRIIGQDRMLRGAAGLKLIDDSISQVADRFSNPIVCVDYLQNMVDTDPRNVRIGVSEIANGLRAISQARDTVVIGISSTGRSFYKPPEKDADNPLSYLGAAKESGDVEFAVANLFFLDVDSEHDANGIYASRIVVPKARRGSIGFVGARFHGPSGHWEEDAAAIAVMSGEARGERARATKVTDYDDKVLAAIREAAIKNTWLTSSGWRTAHDQIGVPRNEVPPAIIRLKQRGDVEESASHPLTRKPPKGGGLGFIVPKAVLP